MERKKKIKFSKEIGDEHMKEPKNKDIESINT